MNNKNVNRNYKGLYTDSSFKDQPKETYPFALNAVNESDRGDFGFLSNEQSNEECASLPSGYIPLGKVYIGNDQTAIFSISSDGTTSEIGILSKDCTYETHVNTVVLGFKINHQIDSTYRLRRGCERTVYFVDGLSKPRIYNFDKPEDYQTNGDWDSDKFNLFKIYSKIPSVDSIEIEENGQLAPGSYNFSIQYLDNDLNPTEWITTTDTVIIYNDSINSKNFENIRGSTNVVSDYEDFGPTNKSITLNISNLDTDFPFYRVAAIEATNGSGRVSRVLVSRETSTNIEEFTYTGDAFSEIPVEEIGQFNNVIETADHIEQIENRLVLGNTKGKQFNYCNLQKYASRISSELITKEIVLNDLSIVDNQKRGTIHNEDIGYMPGEIYSFGIVYIFEDGTTSPVFHIPGKNELEATLMSDDNKCQSAFYTDSNNCEGGDYWGVDTMGEPLVNEQIRHHRFPLRSDVLLPLYEEDTSEEEVLTNLFVLHITGPDVTNGSYDPLDPDPTVEIIVNYTIDDGVTSTPTSTNIVINVEEYNQTVNTVTNSGNLFVTVDSSTDSTFALTSIEEIDYNTGLPPSVPSFGLNYAPIYRTSNVKFINSKYTTRIFGINFNNVLLPDINDTNGEQIVGYYIVRNPRTELTKTILDTGVLNPLIEENRPEISKFIGNGHTLPNATNLQLDTFGLIHPEFKFNNREYSNTTEYILEGVFTSVSKDLSEIITEDVQPGTSYDPEINKRRERDSDGFDLQTLTRNHRVEFTPASEILADNSEINNTFYLNALYQKSIVDTDDVAKDVYNLSSDNKSGFLQLNKKLNLGDITNKLPYVVMKRNLNNPYQNFRVDPFFKETNNPIYFDEGIGVSSTDIYNGDSYVSPMRHTSSMFYDLRLKERANKRGIFNFIFGVLAGVAGGVLAATGNVAGAQLLLGFSLSQVSAGIKKEQINKVYGDLYEEGAKDTVNDVDTEGVFNVDQEDDTIQWFSDTISNLWFESSVNTNWRYGNTIGLPDFLDAPGTYDKTELDNHILQKVTGTDSSGGGGRTYQGFCKAEIYNSNLDFHRRNREKPFFHLGLEYDCCSPCIEEFPQRVHYSEQAFQEELTDNYRTFLPNNYRDIEGETGTITNLFRIQNNLYIHTEEALWHLPQNFQERITSEVVSFIGTGSFFEIPPRKIVDDSTGNSAGSQHKWATLKTPQGVYFIAENQRAVYRFTGNNLDSLSNKNMYNWFKNNLPIKRDEDFYLSTGRDYSYVNNPSNPIGTGFISTYDTRKERVILTKKDIVYGEDISETGDYELCIEGNQVTIFDNFSQTIEAQEALGWEYQGIENCQLKFRRTTTETLDIKQKKEITPLTDIHIFLDTSGSFGSVGGDCITSITDAVNTWVLEFQDDNPTWVGNLYYHEDTTERWVNYLQIAIDTHYPGDPLGDKDLIIVSFCNESDPAPPAYHNGTLSFSVPPPSPEYLSDHANFISLYNQLNSFVGVHYPIVFGDDAGTCDTGGGSIPQSKVFLQHSIAALWGDPMTPNEVASELPNKNPAFTDNEWFDNLLVGLQGTNPYPAGLRFYNWNGKWDRYALPDSTVITAEQFNADMVGLLTELVEIDFPVNEYQYIPGEILGDPLTLNNSWTLSFSNKMNSWTSWHSYLPSFYVHTPERFYSWVPDSSFMWRHNAEHNYQKYYGELNPFIVEYISLSNPMTTRVWNHIRLLTEASQYDSEFNDEVDNRFITFNKALLYNRRQCSGVLNLIVKDTKELTQDYLLNQVQDLEGDSIIIDRNERDWTFNELRDIRTDYTKPIFNKNLEDLQENYYIDKIVNEEAIDYNKDWTNLELFRDKYLAIRLFFDNFEDVKLIFNYSIEDETQSFR